MASLIDYIWQSTFCLLFFFGIYFIFLRNEKAFTFTRFFLLVTPLLAMFFPLLEIPVSFYKPDISLDQSQLFRALTNSPAPEEVAGYYGLPEVTVQSTKLPVLWEFKHYFISGYFAVLLVLTINLYWHYLQLKMFWQKGWYQTVYKLKDKFYLIPTFGLAPVFSYFNKLFWDETQSLSPNEKDQIIKHELEHIRQGHSWDVIYFQLLSIIFWFNPAIHLMRSALVDVHEYLADANVLNKTENKESYPRLIVKLAFKGIDLPIGNYFIRSTTLKRIMMMKKSGKPNWLKTAMILPLSAILLGLVSMKTETGIGHLLGTKTENIEIIRNRLISSQDSLDIGIKVKKIKNPEHYEKIGSLNEGKLTAQLGELVYEFLEITSDEEYLKIRSLINALRQTSVIRKNYGNVKFANQVSKKPEPTSGQFEFQKFLSTKLQENLPEKEKNLGLAFSVEVEYIITKEGKVTNPVIKKSFGAGLDDYLIELVQSDDAPKWQPAEDNGEKVDVVHSNYLSFSSNQTALQEDLNFFQDTPGFRNLLYQPDNARYGDQIFDVVEQAPSPKGGMEAWSEFLAANINYPEGAARTGAEGTVYVVFVVNKEGAIEQPELLRGVESTIDQEALRVINEAPDWNPGMQRGRVVNVRMRLPIKFELPNDSEIKTGLEPVPTQEFFSHISKNMKFPEKSRQDRVTGKVLVQLKLDQSGNITDSKIINGLSDDINQEVMRVMEMAPKWEINGEENEYIVHFPIVFRIGGEANNSIYTKSKNEIIVTAYLSKEEKLIINSSQKLTSKSTFDPKPLYIVDGEITGESEVSKLNSEEIENIKVLKNEEAIVQYGAKARDGVIIITTIKSQIPNPSRQELNILRDQDTTGANYPLIILDGKVISQENLSQIDPKSISKIDVLKGEKAVEAGGTFEKGVIIVHKK